MKCCYLSGNAPGTPPGGDGGTAWQQQPASSRWECWAGRTARRRLWSQQRGPNCKLQHPKKKKRGGGLLAVCCRQMLERKKKKPNCCTCNLRCFHTHSSSWTNSRHILETRPAAARVGAKPVEAVSVGVAQHKLGAALVHIWKAATRLLPDRLNNGFSVCLICMMFKVFYTFK